MTVPPPPHDPSAQPPPPTLGPWGRPTPAASAPSAAEPGGYAPAAAGAAPGVGFGEAGTGVGPEPGNDLGADLGAALAFAGRTLLRNPATYLVSGLIYSAIYLVLILGGVVGGLAVMFAGMDQSTLADPTDAEMIADLLVFYGILFAALVLMIPFALLWQSGAARAAEIVREGGRPTIGQAMVGPMRIILTALLYGVIVGVGTLLLYIPGLIAAVLFMFAIPAAIRGASPVESLKESFALVRANLGTAIVAYLVIMVVSSVASSIIVGVIVLTPFLVLFELGMYERLNGRRLPEPAKK